MKITAIETLQWTAYPRLLIVRVHTDSGLIGLGETVDKIPAAKAALHGTIAPLALGPRTARYRRALALPHGQLSCPTAMPAPRRAPSPPSKSRFGISWVNTMARRFIICSAARAADEIPTYNTCLSFGDVQDYAAWHEDAGALAQSLRDDEIYAMKIWPFDQFSERSFGQRITQAEIEKGLIPIRQIPRRGRRAYGDRH